MAEVELTITLAGEGRTREVSPDAECPLCNEPAQADQVVLRFSDFKAGPGLREHVIHKACLQLLLDATMDDAAPATDDDGYQAFPVKMLARCTAN